MGEKQPPRGGRDVPPFGRSAPCASLTAFALTHPLGRVLQRRLRASALATTERKMGEWPEARSPFSFPWEQEDGVSRHPVPEGWAATRRGANAGHLRSKFRSEYSIDL